MIPHVLLATAAASALIAPLPRQPDPVIEAIRCTAVHMPPVAQALARGEHPLLVVNDIPRGRMEAAPCPAGARPPQGLRRLDYLRPEAAVPLFGREASQGVVRAELAERS